MRHNTREQELTIPQVAKRLGVSRQLIHRWVSQGRIVARRIGRMWVIDEKNCVHPTRGR